VNYRIGAFIAPWTGKLLAYVREHLLGVSLACAAFVVVYQVLARKRRLRKLRDSLPPSSLPPPP
jgi:hypothetical protein